MTRRYVVNKCDLPSADIVAAREDGIDVAELAARVERGAASPDEAVQTLIGALVPGVTSTRESMEPAAAPLPADRSQKIR